ncbi:30S ribosomal protein S16 [Adhaeretor mobilis]|uniref:Small ribosomal subunit protein bS16 n=1 Tax=Adhaeretor mobilis TaxID=1930276 RepID=A0A517MTI8_9BACT|nr:30S ribosomal protein S16 [Adhaeretor mobilis]QDS98097.1 30S ribosomal protein S16 [Adhaeretor mobilis]
MAVRIRMKKMGRTHRPYYRICAIDKRSPRDGRVLEELGTYDPNIADTDARATLKADRIDHWLSVGAQPSDRVGTLIKKYGTGGTRVAENAAAREKHAAPKVVPDAGEPVSKAKDPVEEAAKAEAEAKAAAEAAAADAPATEEKTEEAAGEESKPAEATTEEKAEAPAAKETKEEAPAAEEEAKE